MFFLFIGVIASSVKWKAVCYGTNECNYNNLRDSFTEWGEKYAQNEDERKFAQEGYDAYSNYEMTTREDVGDGPIRISDDIGDAKVAILELMNTQPNAYTFDINGVNDKIIYRLSGNVFPYP